MASRSVVQAILAIAIVVWAIGLTIQGVAVEVSWLRWYSLAVGAAILALIAFDRWLWRWKPIVRFTHRPSLAGTWKGELKSTWTDPATQQPVPPREAHIVIRQTYSAVTVTLLTDESKSMSLTAVLTAPRNGDVRLSYTYVNTPRLLIQDRSRIHHGTALLDAHGKPADVLTGSYWTDRDTKGEMRFDERIRDIHSDFSKAQEAFSQAP